MIKWKFLLPALILRKPPSNKGTKAADLKPIIQRRLNQHDAGDWVGLVTDYERDVISASHIHPEDSRSQDDKEEAQIRRAAELLERFQCSKARRYLQSNGMGDHRNPDIVQQMKRKHPARKKAIRKLTEAELEFGRKGINRDVFDLKHRQLKHDVAPALGCLRN